MPVPASARSMFGTSFWRRGAKTDVASSAIAVCPARGSDRDPVSLRKPVARRRRIDQ